MPHGSCSLALSEVGVPQSAEPSAGSGLSESAQAPSLQRGTVTLGSTLDQGRAQSLGVLWGSGMVWDPS